MLFPLSGGALAHNWIGPLVVDFVSEGMRSIDNEEDPPSWPPAGVLKSRRAWLDRNSGFNKKISKVLSDYRGLDGSKRQSVRQALVDQTSIPALFSTHAACTLLQGMGGVESAISELFEYCFAKLASSDDSGSAVRDRHYSDIYDGLSERVCPFCGLSPLRGKLSPRHHLDHWMAISIYPFAGADLRNLCPMCDACNSTFKGKKDVLHGPGGGRRRVSDPYLGPVYKVSLSNSEWGRGSVGKFGFVLPLWKIEFSGGAAEEAETWDDVLSIRSRYKNDVLDPEFMSWVGHFSRWFNEGGMFARDHGGIVCSFDEYIDIVVQERFSDVAFLKVEVFKFLRACAGNPECGEDVTSMLLSIAENVK